MTPLRILLIFVANYLNTVQEFHAKKPYDGHLQAKRVAEITTRGTDPTTEHRRVVLTGAVYPMRSSRRGSKNAMPRREDKTCPGQHSCPENKEQTQ